MPIERQRKQIMKNTDISTYHHKRRRIGSLWTGTASAFTLMACTASATSQEAFTDVTFTDHIHVMPLQDLAGRGASIAPRADAAPAGAHLTLFGGKVIQNVRVTQVLYGSGTY